MSLTAETSVALCMYRWSRAKSCLRVVALLFLITSMTIAPAQDRELVVGTSIWPPYVDPKLPGQGLAVSIVTAALERSGYRVVIKFEDWERTLSAAKAGETAVIAAAWYTPERERDFLFSEPYLTNEIKFLKRRGTPFSYQSLDDLKGLRIGVVYGYAYSPEFDRAAGFTRAPETHVVPNIVELLSGSIGLMVGDERTLRYELARHFGKQRRDLEFLPKPLASRELHLVVSRAHPQAHTIVNDFNRGLAEIRRDGTYRKLLRQSNEEIWKRSYLAK